MKKRLKREERIKTITKELNLNGKFLELGVLRGAFSNHLLQCNPSELILVDAWKSHYDEFDFTDYPTFDQAKWDLLHDNVVAKFSKDERVKIMRMLGDEAAKLIPNESLDLVYIDANHDYEPVLKDLNTWLPKIKKGGILCGHDFQHKGVNKAVNEFWTKWRGRDGGFEITEEVGCATYFLIK